MSEILVIVPPEWTAVDMDTMSGLVGYTQQTWADMQGHDTRDLNAALEGLGWFQDERRVIDVMVINQQLFFKLATGFFD